MPNFNLHIVVNLFINQYCFIKYSVLYPYYSNKFVPLRSMKADIGHFYKSVVFMLDTDGHPNVSYYFIILFKLDTL